MPTTVASEISRLQQAKADLKTAIEGKGVTVSSAATIDAYAGYVADIEEAAPAVTHPQPTISVSSGGLITASHTQGYGTVAAGTTTNTQQLTVQAAQTITPTTSDQTIASGRYLTGTQTIKGDANLIAANIASGKTIFGVAGTHSGGASNIITGEFTAQSSSGVQSITLSYSGSGYPIMAYIVVKGGMYTSGTTWYTTTHQYAVGAWTMSKAVMSSAPTYGTSGTANYGVTATIYKSSSSSSTSYSRGGGQTSNTFSSSNATNAAATCARFKSKTSLSIYASAAGGTYGFMAGQTYQYVIVYSS